MKIVIADDHALFRGSLRSLLGAGGLGVVGEAGTGREAVGRARRLTPDVVLMALGRPEVDGLAATRLICADQPQVKVLILTASDEDAKLFEAIKSGAQGYLLKNLEARELFSILERVQEGEPALTPAVARRLLQEFASGGTEAAAAPRTAGTGGRAGPNPHPPPPPRPAGARPPGPGH